MNAAYLVVDTETTGVDPAEHRAVEVAAVMVKAGQISVGGSGCALPMQYEGLGDR